MAWRGTSRAAGGRGISSLTTFPIEELEPYLPATCQEHAKYALLTAGSDFLIRGVSCACSHELSTRSCPFSSYGSVSVTQGFLVLLH